MKTYTYKETKDKDLFRVVDRYGDWTHYWHKPTDKYLRAVNFILDQGYAKPGLKQWLLNTTAEQAEKTLQRAGDKGSHVHRFIEQIFEGATITRESRVFDDGLNEEVKITIEEFDNLLAFKSFWTRHEPTLIEYEIPSYNIKVGFAGTTDAIIKLTKTCGVKSCGCESVIGKVGLWDWKNSSGIRAENGAQVAAYTAGQNLNHKIQYTAILRLGTRHKTTGGYEIETYDAKETKQHYKEFLSAMTIANSEYKPFDQKAIYEVEDVIKITIKKHAKLQMPVRSEANAGEKNGKESGKVVFHMPATTR